MASKPQEVDPTKLSLKALDDLKLGYAKDILDVTARLAAQCKRKDGTAIIERFGTDIEQLLAIGHEVGYRQAVKDHRL